MTSGLASPGILPGEASLLNLGRGTVMGWPQVSNELAIPRIPSVCLEGKRWGAWTRRQSPSAEGLGLRPSTPDSSKPVGYLDAKRRWPRGFGFSFESDQEV